MNNKTKEQLEQRKEGESFFETYEQFKDVPAMNYCLIKESMFTGHYSQDILDEMPKCLRVMPHYQNTSGFFITIIEKLEEMDGASPDIKQSEEEHNLAK